MKRRKADPVFGQRVAQVLQSRFGFGRRNVFDEIDVLERIRRGAVIKASPPQPGMPHKYQLDRARRELPAFNVAVLEAIAEARRRKKNRQTLKKLGRDAAWSVANRAVPQSIDIDLRSDIVGELALLICEGEVAVDEDLGVAWRRCRTRLSGHRWKETSLDAPIHGADNLTRLDLLASDTPRF